MTERVGKAFVLPPGEGRAIDLGGFSVSVKAGADDTDGAFSLLEADEPTGFGPPLHIHHDAAETFYVLAGEYIIYLGGTRNSLSSRIVHLHPGGHAPLIQGWFSRKSKIEPLHAGGHDGLLR